MNILDQINQPEDLSKLSPEQLNTLAAEVRERIICTVASNGGHLASNLGIVELTLALLLEFNFPDDKIVFDVGHQSYPYKLLTGRRDRFATLRREHGISGFPKREESEYDFFNTGHSSTAISAALGLLQADSLHGKSNHVLAVVGDGALTGGMALEAMNDACQFPGDDASKRLIVILNDNQMSISRNVGSISRHLEKLRLSPRYNRLKVRVEPVLQRLPLLGRPLLNLFEKTKRALRGLARSESGFFETMGFRYYGPIDGHDLPQLRKHLRTIKTLTGPLVLHVITQKGRGYNLAECSPDIYHGVAPFVIENGIVPDNNKKTPRFSDSFGEALCEIAAAEPRLYALTAAMPDGTGLTEFARIFPERFHDCGIAEQHTVTLAAGMAAGGLKPVVAMYATFLQRAYDQILHDICLQNLPVVLAIDRAGIVGEDGETHQGIYDISFLLPMPNMHVLAPRDSHELTRMLAATIEINGPAAIRYPRGRSPEYPELVELTPAPAGKAELLRTGSEATLLSTGTSARAALDAAAVLENEGHSIEVIDLRWLKPLDWETISASVSKTGRVLIVEEGVAVGGVGSVITGRLATEMPGVSIANANLDDRIHPQAKREQILAAQGLNAEGLARQLRLLLQK